MFLKRPIMLALAAVASFGSFACRNPKTENKDFYIVEIFAERLGSKFKPEIRSIRKFNKIRQLKLFPGLELEYVDSNGESHLSPCAHSCFMGHIASIEPLPADSPGIIFECEWVAIFRVNRPMKSFKIIKNGVAIVEGQPNLKNLTYERPKQ